MCREDGVEGKDLPLFLGSFREGVPGRLGRGEGGDLGMHFHTDYMFLFAHLFFFCHCYFSLDLG